MDAHAINDQRRHEAYQRDIRVMPGWTKSLVVERDAVLLPQTRFGVDPEMPATGPRGQREIANGGVYTCDGLIVPSAIHLGGPFRYVPDHWNGRPPAIERLPGAWLFGGLLRGHFGHFVLESLGRLWGAEGRGDIAGIVYLNLNGALRVGEPALARAAQATLRAPFIGRLIDLFAGNLPVRVVGPPLEIEELVIPAQLIGNSNAGDHAGGHPDFRAFVHRRMARFQPSAGAPRRRLYISRSRLPAGAVSFLFETVFEQALAEEDYEIIHPETLSIEQQLEAYAAAAEIVTPTGSAIHLAAYAMNGRQRVAIINRQEAAFAKFVRQLELFGAREVVGSSRPWATVAVAQPRAGVRKQPAQILDLDAIWADLLAAGFVTHPRRFGLSDPAMVEAALEILSEQLDRDDLVVIPVGSDQRTGKTRRLRS